MKNYLQLGTGEWISKEECEKLIMDFANSVLEDFPEELNKPKGEENNDYHRKKSETIQRMDFSNHGKR